MMVAPFASLPMYDLPELREATDAFWGALAKRLGIAVGLHRDGDYFAGWREPGLIFSQTCGYPLTHEFKDKLTLVATPQYAADGCVGSSYRSIIMAREAVALQSLRGSVAAFNNRDSMSGMLVLKLVFQPLARSGQFFAGAIETGGHVASLAALQRGDAAVAAIDCVTVAYLRRVRPQALEGLHEIAHGPLVPALPFVTRIGDVVQMRPALDAIFADASLQHVREALLLEAVSAVPITAYEVILQLETAMEAAGGLSLW